MRTLFVHLRLHFQLLLAPVFLWGWLLAGGGLSRSVVLGFISFHVFLYSGATAFNSYYDRDIGPVGGLERPPGVVPTLLPFVAAGKPVFEVEYKLSTGQFCPQANAMNFNALKKNLDLDASREPCR